MWKSVPRFRQARSVRRLAPMRGPVWQRLSVVRQPGSHACGSRSGGKVFLLDVEIAYFIRRNVEYHRRYREHAYAIAQDREKLWSFPQR